MDMSEQDVFDPAVWSCVEKLAKSFDRFGSTPRHGGAQMVMLSGRELQQFAMEIWRQRINGTVIPEASGRRASDQVIRERMVALEQENAQLRAANDLLEAFRARDRRKQDLPFSHPERRATP